MKIGIGSDHGGFAIKEILSAALKKYGHTLEDAGTKDSVSCDYPDFAKRVADGVSKRVYNVGILVCGSGIGMSIVANKYKGVRAAVVWNKEIAKLSREHNDSNVLCLPGRFLSIDEALEITQVWLKTAFAGDRHARRLEKITQLEKELLK